MHARARQYSPMLGRFAGRDKNYLDGTGLYAAHFSPNSLDPKGWAVLSVSGEAKPTKPTCTSNGRSWDTTWEIAPTAGESLPSKYSVVQRIDITWSATDCSGKPIPLSAWLPSSGSFLETWRFGYGDWFKGRTDNWSAKMPPPNSKGTVMMSGSAWYLPVDSAQLSSQWAQGNDSIANQIGNGSGEPSGDLPSMPSSSAPYSLSAPTSNVLRRYMTMRWDCCCPETSYWGSGVYYFNHKWL